MAGLSYQCVVNKLIATALSVSRQGLFYIPAVLVLPLFMDLLGVQSCQSVADVCAFLFALPFTFLFFNTLKKEQKKADEEGRIVDDTKPPVMEITE